GREGGGGAAAAAAVPAGAGTVLPGSVDARERLREVVEGHFSALVEQMLKAEGLQAGAEGDPEGWLEVVRRLASEAASLVRPDSSSMGGYMDPGGYIKVKCIAGGKRSESCVVDGVVCRKNVANKRMASDIRWPHIALLASTLEYQRCPNRLSSIDTLLAQ
ncbi:unnamed protein product, partial [Closterium sp. NIES-54]